MIGPYVDPSDPPNPIMEGMNFMVMTMANRAMPTGWNIETSYVKAPHSLATLNMSVNNTGRITVWCDEYENPALNIYGCNEHNAAARAWHDSVHWRLQLPFNFAGECATVYAQIWAMLQQYGHDDESEKFATLLLVEIIGQAMEHRLYGEFPADSWAFAVEHRDDYSRLAAEVCAHLADEGATELDAVRLAAETWGKA